MITLQKAGVREEFNFMRRVYNIKYIAGLNRLGYTFYNPAPPLNLKTINNETISIIYPGKETIPRTATSIAKIWDFRPIITINNTTMKDLTFGDIWWSIADFINSFQKDSHKVAILLAKIFYKVAFYMSHTDNNLWLFNKDLLSREERELFNYPINILDTQGNHIPISLDSFITYNDLLCLNEDCKYFYIKNINDNNNVTNILYFNNYIDLKNNISWEASTGRINTFLTHINYIIHLAGYVPTHIILESASRGQGVFPVQNNQDLINLLNQSL